MSEAARLPYGGIAAQEIEGHDERLSDENVQNPVKFAHEVIGSYLLAAGDFVSGLQHVVKSGPNLRFSSPSLARSACEYSAIAWWLGKPESSVTDRLGQVFAALRMDMKHPANVDQYGEAGREFVARTEQWIGRQEFKIFAGLPKILDLQEAMFPNRGRVDYKYLSGLVHGQFTHMLRGVHDSRTESPSRELEMWVEVLIATARGLAAAYTVAYVRGAEPEHLINMCLLHDHYSDQLQIPRLLSVAV